MRKKRTAFLSLTGPRQDAVTVVLFSLVLFLTMHVWSEPYSLVLAFLAFLVCIGRTPWRLARERFCVPVLGFAAFVLLYGAAAIYSPFGVSAVRDFRGALAAFAMAALVLFRIEKRHIRGLLWGIAAICALVSLLCTSFACEGPLYEAFCSVMDLFGQSSIYRAEIENSIGRVNGIYNDANVSASILALGTLVSLYLARTGVKWWERLLACVLVSTSAMGILLSASRGAILCFGLSLLVWLAAAGKGERFRLFLLLVETAGVTLAASVPAGAAVAPGGLLPNVLAIVSGGAAFLLDWVLGDRLARLFGGHKKAMTLVVAVVVVLGLIYVMKVVQSYTFASRLFRDDFFSSVSFLYRVEFDKDAWKIFKQRPFFGYGLGSTDNLYPAVQSFYYTSRYAHNHILQVMADMGLVGLAAFLAFLSGVFWLLVCQLRKEQGLLAAMLLACWIMMNTHSLMEINFSVQAYQSVAFVLLLFPVVLYGRPLSEAAAKTGSTAIWVGFLVYLALFGGLMGMRQTVRREYTTRYASSMDEAISWLADYAKRDVFEPERYETEYVAATAQDASGQHNLKMLEYVEKIRNSGNYPSCSALPRAYYLQVGDFEGLFDCSRDCLLMRASYAAVWNEQASFYREEVLRVAGEENIDVFLEGVLAFYSLLEETNQRLTEPVSLTSQNQAFVELALSAKEQNFSGVILYEYLLSGE